MCEPGKRASCSAARSGHEERTIPFGAQHRVHDQEGDTAAVVAVQMREQHRVERIGMQALLGQRDQRRGPEVDGEARGGAVDHDTRLEAAAAAERVAGADDPHRHGHGAIVPERPRWAAVRS